MIERGDQKAPCPPQAGQTSVCSAAQDAYVGQRLDRRAGIPMVDEPPAGRQPPISRPHLVIDQDVAWLGMPVLVGRPARNNRRAREMPIDPPPLLSLGPPAPWQAGEDDRVEMPDRIEQLQGIGQQRQQTIEIWMVGKPAPKLGRAVLVLEASGRHAQEALASMLEIGQDAVAVQEDLHGRSPQVGRKEKPVRAGFYHRETIG